MINKPSYIRVAFSRLHLSSSSRSSPPDGLLRARNVANSRSSSRLSGPRSAAAVAPAIRAATCHVTSTKGSPSSENSALTACTSSESRSGTIGSRRRCWHRSHLLRGRPGPGLRAGSGPPHSRQRPGRFLMIISLGLNSVGASGEGMFPDRCHLGCRFHDRLRPLSQ
jgi:hypothetical protein